jgi:hypothetical protein
MRRLAKLYNELLLWAIGEEFGSSNGIGVHERVALSSEKLPEASVDGMCLRGEEVNSAPEMPMGHLYAIGPLWIYVVDRPWGELGYGSPEG